MQRQLKPLFEPKTVAVIGSARRGKIGHQLITQLTEGDFPGTIWAVNPRAAGPEDFPSVPAVSSVTEIQETLDLAIICAPAAYTARILEECGEKSVPVAVIITSGFSETGNHRGEEELKTIAARYNIRLIGPNCAGVMNTATRFFASIEVRALPGTVAFITQSGAVGGAVLAMAEQRGIGFSKFISCGNRADIGEIEFLDFLEQDPETDAIALYLESVQDGRAFLDSARRIADKKPLMVIKAGKSSSGMRATGSHTGSMAGSNDVFDAMVKQTGIIRVADIEEMLDLCNGFSQLPPLKGRNIAVVTNSGGPGILTADKAEELGLHVAVPDEATKAQLHEFLSPHCSVSNPFDLTVEGTEETFRKTLDVLLAGNYDGAIAINVATPFLDSQSLARGIIDAAAMHRKPVAAVFMAGRIVKSGIATLHSEGIPTFPTGERAANVFSKIVEKSGAHSAEHERRGEIEEKTLPLHSPILEPEAVAFLENEGFPFPSHIFVTDEKQIQEQQTVSYPAVMKVVSAEILHKSDEGGVILGINSAVEARTYYRKMKDKFAHRRFKGVMLYDQVPKAVEMIAGITGDPDFGPVIAVGAGGIYTEVLKDISLRIAPFDRDEALQMISELKTAPLLGGYRGKKPLAVGAFAELITRLSRLAAAYPAISELDLNPVFLFEDHVLVGDTRILTGE